MSNLLNKTVKFTIGTCFTLGAVAVAASAVAGSNLGKVVSAGFKGAKSAVEKELAELKADEASVEERAMFADAEDISAENVKVSSSDFED